MPLKLLRATQSWPGHKVIFLMENGEHRQESFYQAENGMHLDAYSKNKKYMMLFQMNGIVVKNLEGSLQMNFLTTMALKMTFP